MAAHFDIRTYLAICSVRADLVRSRMASLSMPVQQVAATPVHSTGLTKLPARTKRESIKKDARCTPIYPDLARATWR
jgi:hypothetical protein